VYIVAELQHVGAVAKAGTIYGFLNSAFRLYDAMARTRARPAPPSGSPQPEARAGSAQAEVQIGISMQVGLETVTYYANFAEIAFLQHDFAMLFGRVPAKLPLDKQEEAKAGLVTLTSDVQILIPANMIVGLMRALATAKAAYEQRYGVLHEPGGSDADSGGP
jgi:hypothetical protein